MLIVELKDKTLLEVEDTSTQNVFNMELTEEDNPADFAAKLTDDNLSYFRILQKDEEDDTTSVIGEYFYYKFDSYTSKTLTLMKNVINEETKEVSSEIDRIVVVAKFKINKLSQDDINMINLKKDVAAISKEVYGTEIDTETCAVEELKEHTLKELSKACHAAIVAGVDVETTAGKEHFSLEEDDQINMKSLYDELLSGTVDVVPYHADGELCRLFSKEEFLTIMDTVSYWKTYNTTLHNHIKYWVSSCDNKEDLLAVTFSRDTLPEELQTSFDDIITHVLSVKE